MRGMPRSCPQFSAADDAQVRRGLEESFAFISRTEASVAAPSVARLAAFKRLVEADAAAYPDAYASDDLLRRCWTRRKKRAWTGCCRRARASRWTTNSTAFPRVVLSCGLKRVPARIAMHCALTASLRTRWRPSAGASLKSALMATRSATSYSIPLSRRRSRRNAAFREKKSETKRENPRSHLKQTFTFTTKKPP